MPRHAAYQSNLPNGQNCARRSGSVWTTARAGSDCSKPRHRQHDKLGIARVGNDQFLRSMIPHHSSAIVMCEESSITDPDILSRCDEIVETQEREIAEMNELLAR